VTAPLSVTEVTERIDGAIAADPALADCAVRGEISNYKRHTSGHLYFSMKDEGAALSCVMWRSAAGGVAFQPTDGLEVIAEGRIGVYAPQGKYQLYVDRLRRVGTGDLWARFEELKRLLEAEGLFLQARKRSLPPFPRAVAVISSATGAATQDMLKILARRFPPARIEFIAATVQGDAAPESIRAALAAADEIADVDVTIVGRGGGSMEDLWCFNDERVVRAVAGCRMPVISAIGHETDVTLCDFAADLRAPTPSAAAELAVPEATEVRRHVDALGLRLTVALRGAAERGALVLKAFDGRLPFGRPQDLFAAKWLALDDLDSGLIAAADSGIRRRQAAFDTLSAKLGALGPIATLARGYAVARRSDGRVIASVTDVGSGDKVDVLVADGTVHTRVEATSAASAESGVQ